MRSIRSIPLGMVMIGLILFAGSCGLNTQSNRPEETRSSDRDSNRISDAYYVASIDRLRDVAIPVVIVKTTNQNVAVYPLHSEKFHGVSSDNYTFAGEGSEGSYRGGPLSTGSFGVVTAGASTSVSGQLTKKDENSIQMQIRGKFPETALSANISYTMIARTKGDTLKVLRALYTPRAGHIFSQTAEGACQAGFSLTCAEIFRR